MDSAPTPTHARSLAPSERKQKIVRGIGTVIVLGVLLGLILAPDVFHGLSTPAAYLVSAAVVCFFTFMGFLDEPLTVPARLQFRLYVAAVLAGLVWAWLASLVDNYWVGVICLFLIGTAFKFAAARMIKKQRV